MATISFDKDLTAKNLNCGARIEMSSRTARHAPPSLGSCGRIHARDGLLAAGYRGTTYSGIAIERYLFTRSLKVKMRHGATSNHFDDYFVTNDGLASMSEVVSESRC
jgi:hypothetical protein